MNLILIFPEELTADGHVCLTDERAAHIRHVLRGRIGKKLRIGLLNGPFGTGTIEDVSEKSIRMCCEWNGETPPRPPIDLLLAMPRPKVLKRLWAQFAALGAGRIFLTNADKVERCYFDSHILNPAFYTARLVEGLQQARDTLVPDVTVVKQLKPFIEDGLDSVFPRFGKRLVADPSAARTLFQCLETVGEKVPKSGTRALLAVGPEGGWTPYELDLLEAHGFERFATGSRILRTDTACIGLITLLAEGLKEHYNLSGDAE
jgi:16S rRNA (uracil1498-N3)-methyltransferase